MPPKTARREHFKAGGVEIVVTDWEMPVLSGLDLVKRIRESAAAAPLSRGRHTVHFRSVTDGVVQDVTYHLTVAPGK